MTKFNNFDLAKFLLSFQMCICPDFGLGMRKEPKIPVPKIKGVPKTPIPGIAPPIRAKDRAAIGMFARINLLSIRSTRKFPIKNNDKRDDKAGREKSLKHFQKGDGHKSSDNVEENAELYLTAEYLVMVKKKIYLLKEMV